MAILNNMIVMNRGDTKTFDLFIANNELSEIQYVLTGDDAVYFGIMDPHQPFERALVRKKYTKNDLDANGNLIIIIQPEDTLDLIPGKYYYAIKLHMCHPELSQDGHETGNFIDRVLTLVNKTKFILCD